MPTSPRTIVLAGQSWTLEPHLAPDGICRSVRARGDDGRIARGKLLRPTSSVTSSRAASFAVLVPRLCALRGNGVVSVLAGGESDGWFCVLTELFDGTGFDTWLSTRGVVPPGQAQWLFDALCAGVHVAHRVGIVHRCIHPQTAKIGVLPDGRHRVAWVDFELATVLSGHAELPRDFIAPEQREGIGTESARADVFSLAALYVAMRMGTLTPERTMTWAAWVESQGAELRPRLGELLPTVPARLLDVLAVALHASASERPENAQQLRTLFRRALQGSGAWLAAPEPEAITASPPPSPPQAPVVTELREAPPIAFVSRRQPAMLSEAESEMFPASPAYAYETGATLVSVSPQRHGVPPEVRVVDEEPTPQDVTALPMVSDTVIDLSAASARARRATFSVESEGLAASHPPFAMQPPRTTPNVFSHDDASQGEVDVTRQNHLPVESATLVTANTHAPSISANPVEWTLPAAPPSTLPRVMAPSTLPPPVAVTAPAKRGTSWLWLLMGAVVMVTLIAVVAAMGMRR